MWKGRVAESDQPPETTFTLEKLPDMKQYYTRQGATEHLQLAPQAHYCTETNPILSAIKLTDQKKALHTEHRHGIHCQLVKYKTVSQILLEGGILFLTHGKKDTRQNENK